MGLIPHEYMTPWILGCFSLREHGNWNPSTPHEGGIDIVTKVGKEKVQAATGDERDVKTGQSDRKKGKKGVVI